MPWEGQNTWTGQMWQCDGRYIWLFISSVCPGIKSPSGRWHVRGHRECWDLCHSCHVRHLSVVVRGGTERLSIPHNSPIVTCLRHVTMWVPSPKYLKAANDLRSEWTLTGGLRAFQECLDDRRDPGRDLRWMTVLIWLTGKLVTRTGWRRETRCQEIFSCPAWPESGRQTRSVASHMSVEARVGSCLAPLEQRNNYVW